MVHHQQTDRTEQTETEQTEEQTSDPTPTVAPNAPSNAAIAQRAQEVRATRSAQGQEVIPVEQLPDYGDVLEYSEAMDAVEKPAKDPTTTGSKTATKPDMTGIGSNVAVGRFVTAAKKIKADWAKLNATQRAKRMAAASNAELKSADVLEAAPVVKNMSDAGQFDFSTWQLDLGKGAFQKATPTKAEVADMADTVYHETRHCEQWHRMARLRAGAGKTANEIKAEMFIPKKAADHAHARKLTGAGKAVDEAKAWYKNIYGTGRTARNAVLNELPAATTALQNATRAEANLPGTATAAQRTAAANATKAARTRYNTALAAYKNLVEEADAWKVAGKVTAGMMK